MPSKYAGRHASRKAIHGGLEEEGYAETIGL
jgi:hypothetical protein